MGACWCVQIVLVRAGVRLAAIGGPMLRLSTERFSAKGLVARQARRMLWMLLLVRYSKQY